MSLCSGKGSGRANALLNQTIVQTEREIAALKVNDISRGDSESILDGAFSGAYSGLDFV